MPGVDGITRVRNEQISEVLGFTDLFIKFHSFVVEQNPLLRTRITKDIRNQKQATRCKISKIGILPECVVF
jgi:hypothetical protein